MALRSSRILSFLSLSAAAALAATGATAAPSVRDGADAKFRSPLLRKGFVEVDVDVAGAKDLYLAVLDGGDGYGCDWADWAEPRLEGPGGTTKLTDLRWKSATAGWGRVRVGSNAGGGPLGIAGKVVPYGIGTHAPSLIHYVLPAGCTRFRARAGLDNGGTDQGCGSTVVFLVFTGKPPADVLRAARRERSRGGGPLEPAEAREELELYEGLEATLFAHEPMIVNPTNLDIDERGRVWVTEGVNYRRWRDLKPEGDRIVILEDTDGDGRADSSKVFYQSTDINSALGICVLGSKVIVSCSPNVFVFTDEDGDDRPDEKQVLFSGIGGHQHDHGVHAFVFGPDGRLYFNFGNSGGRLLDGHGRPVVDLAGNPVEARGRPYRQGMVFRCELDGSRVETLGHNFRNNYEVAVDSFGTLWQSDNDDDGNRGVRINYVMEYGNFGYQDELTGAGWRSPRTGMHPEVPTRHWHQNDPGVVPNFLQTGAGSPTGICVYEGDLLPRVFRNEVIHCDAGPNVVRAYPARKDGAGYSGAIVDLVKSVDRWFRPSDVCVAADGSLFISDWYDAGVGGHNMADNHPGEMRGRIFRVAPRGHRRRIPLLDVSTARAAREALRSPNQARRYAAWTALRSMGKNAESALLEMWAGDAPRMRARALHLLSRIPGREEHRVREAARDPDPDIRILSLRIARQRGLDVIPLVRQLVADPSPQVRRECAIALRHCASPAAPELWTELASRHDGRDRWYLEALGIGAGGREEEFFGAWLERVGEEWNTPAGRDIVWRSRSPRAPSLLVEILEERSTPPEHRPRYLRAFDFHRGKERETALVALLGSKDSFVSAEALRRFGKLDIRGNPKHRSLVETLLERSRGTGRYVELVRRFELPVDEKDLLEVIARHPADTAGADAARLLLERGGTAVLAEKLSAEDGKELAFAVKLARALGNTDDRRAVPLLLPLAVDEDGDAALVGQAVRSLARTRRGAEALLETARDGRLPDDMRTAAGVALSNVPWDDVRGQAIDRLPLPPAKDDEPLPPIPELVRRRGDPARGAKVYEALCMNCHVVGEKGKDFGPNLSEIGDKLPRDALYLSILDPNAGVSFNYEGTGLTLRSGDEVVGIVMSETDDSITLKTAGAIVTEYPGRKVVRRRRLNVSIMPADLQRGMTAGELVDLVEFLAGLRAGRKAPPGRTADR